LIPVKVIVESLIPSPCVKLNPVSPPSVSLPCVDVSVTWVGGHTSAGRIVRPVARLDRLSYYPALLARI